MWRRIAFGILRASGWTVVGEIPPFKKAVIIAAPHTSNWDGFWLIVCKVALDIKLRFFAKHTLFWWPLGSLLTALGAIPVEKSRSGSNVDKLVKLFEDNDELYLALAPEGTRKWRPYWRSGFYRIAQAANVPIVMAFIDYRNKRAGIGPQVDSSGTAADTMSQIRAFYESCGAAKPENMGPIALKNSKSMDPVMAGKSPDDAKPGSDLEERHQIP